MTFIDAVKKTRYAFTVAKTGAYVIMEGMCSFLFRLFVTTQQQAAHSYM